MKEDKIISVCITTYNHEKYITKSLQSVLDQNTEYSFEIIVGDDSPNNNTKKAINQLIKLHPKGKLIRYFHHPKSLGYVKNQLFTFSQSNAKYIAILDGDDYWIDNKKLQKQVNYLEHNNNFSAVASDSKVIYEDEETPSHNFTIFHDKELEINDLLNLQLFQTSTFLFTRNILKEDIPTQIISLDRCLYLLAGCFGKVKVLKEQTSIYKKSTQSISAAVTLAALEKDLKIYPFILKYTNKINRYKFKSYLYYTFISYSKNISTKQFKKYSFYFLFNKVFSEINLNPITVRRTIINTINTIKDKKATKIFIN